MSSVSTWRRPARSLISSASAYVSATPSVISANGMPCDPVCAVQPGQPRPVQIRPHHPLARPSSRSATPNFEVAVAVDSASMEPPPTWGLTRMPSGERLVGGSPLGHQTVEALQLLRIVRVDRDAQRERLAQLARRLGGRVQHGPLRRHTRRPGQCQFTRARELRADALLVQQLHHRDQRGRLHREGVQHGRPGRRHRLERGPQRRRRLPYPGDVQQPDDRDVRSEQPLLHGRPHRLVPPRRPLPRRCRRDHRSCPCRQSRDPPSARCPPTRPAARPTYPAKHPRRVRAGTRTY